MAIKYLHCLHSSESTYLLCQWRWHFMSLLGCCLLALHTVLQRYFLACVRSQRCHSRITGCTNALVRTHDCHLPQYLCMVSVSLAPVCTVMCVFYRLISLFITVQQFSIFQFQTVMAQKRKLFDYHLFLILTISESHSEAEELFIDRLQVNVPQHTLS